MEPTVEPLSEVEFDAFATEIAEQVIAWLERDQVSLPVTITPPEIDHGSTECRGVAKAFSRRFAEGLSDRLRGAVRFRRTCASRPRLRCGVSFTEGADGQADRMVTFRLWDADSNLEICQGSYDYHVRPKPLLALRRQLEQRRLAARAPGEDDESSGSAGVPPVGEPMAAAVGPAPPKPPTSREQPSQPGAESPASKAGASEVAAAAGEAVQREAVATAVGSREPDVATARQELPKPPCVASGQTPVTAPRGNSSVERNNRTATVSEHNNRTATVSEGNNRTATVSERTERNELVERMRSADLRRMPPRRTLRIDRHEHGLARLVQEQAIYFSDRTITDELGKMIFLDRRAWEGVAVEVRQTRRTRDGHLSIELSVQARGQPLEADLRVIYLAADGGQLEVSPVRTFEFSPSYVKPIVLHSSRTGAARYLVLVSHG